MKMEKIELPVLDIQGLDIRLPRGADRELAVQGASLQLLPGQTLCVVGESGSGKSMIANAIMGLLPRPHVEPVAGKILFDGQDLLQLNESQLRELRGRRMGMVFQEPMTALNPVMRIGEQIAEVFDAHVSLSAAEKRKRILAALADVGLPEPEVLIDSYPFRLSGGQRQRVMIACALVLEPALLICDEPTTALDVTTQAQILKLIRELQQRKGTAVLFITHDFGVVSEIADQVVVMQTGQVVEAGPAAAVLAHPQHAYTRKLIAAIPNGQVRTTADEREVEHVLQVQDLRKTYVTGGSLFKKGRRVEAAKGLSFDVRRGETLGLVGESGSGKSTVGRCIVGLAPFDSGRILFKGRALQSGAQFRQQTQGKIQMVFQDPYASLNPRHRVGSAIAQGPIAQGLSKEKAMARAMELLELVGLKPDAADRFPLEFSGGQRQRIGIARALAMVFITHDLRVAGEMSDHLAVMQRGQIVAYGETAKVLANPQHAYTRTLIEAQPRLSAAAVEAVAA